MTRIFKLAFADSKTVTQNAWQTATQNPCDAAMNALVERRSAQAICLAVAVGFLLTFVTGIVAVSQSGLIG